MKCTFLSKGHHPTLTLFFAGWGMDATPFEDYSTPHSDFAVIWDYTVLDWNCTLINTYHQVRLVAWSMGVWAASQFFAPVDCAEAIAINGTPTPISDSHGIPCDIFVKTCEQLSETSLAKFQRRMCLNASAYEDFKLRHPKRFFPDVSNELLAIAQHVHSTMGSTSTDLWTKAYCGVHDRIFPHANQHAAFPHAIDCDAAHYDEALLRYVIGGER